MDAKRPAAHMSNNHARKMELLAPAGGMDQLRAAVRFGADAVYLAADRFGMRARAANFALADIPDAVEVAHASGVKVHVAVNTMMDADDIEALPAYLRALDDAGIDALIVADMGAFAIARKTAPRLELHVSTQAGVMNAAAARAWHELGAARVVCAREMSLEDIARMRQDAPADLQIEAFAHGAMCMAFSGRCLISAYLTGRSANKGHCTQPCRWSYTLEEEKRPGVHFPVEEDGGTFIMNAQDLSMIGHLDALAAAGVDSIKIEGRNKKAFYVACVVGAYRRVLDGTPPAAVIDELEAVSHRPYGTGFYFGPPAQATDFDGYEQQTMHVADVVACEACPDASAGERASAEGQTEGTDKIGGVPSRRPADVPAPTAYALVACCRNRFSEGDELEVLSPHCAVRTVKVCGLEWLPEPTDENPAPAPVPVEVANRSCNRYRFKVGGPIEAGSFLRTRTYRRSARHGKQAVASALDAAPSNGQAVTPATEEVC